MRGLSPPRWCRPLCKVHHKLPAQNTLFTKKLVHHTHLIRLQNTSEVHFYTNNLADQPHNSPFSTDTVSPHSPCTKRGRSLSANGLKWLKPGVLSRIQTQSPRSASVPHVVNNMLTPHKLTINPYQYSSTSLSLRQRMGIGSFS